jgi:hypothetical protein
MGLVFAAAFVLSFPAAFAHASVGGKALLVVLALAVITGEVGVSDRFLLAKYVAAPVATACTVLEARGEADGTLPLAIALLTSIGATASR